MHVRPSGDEFEVLTMGRIGVDLYPQQVGVSLDEVESFAKYLGGSASNVAVAAARYGRRTAVITRTGDDPFGTFLHKALRGYGVDDQYVTGVKNLPTPVTFCEIFPPDDFPLYFYRLPKAPDLEIYTSELDLDAIKDAGVFWVTVTGLSEEPSRSATLAALEARARKDITVLDLDYRPMFWPSREEARRWVRHALPHVTVAVGNLDECETAVGEREPLAAARALHGFGVKLAVVKQGPKGVLASLSPQRGARGVWGGGGGSSLRGKHGQTGAGRRHERPRCRRRVRRSALPRAAGRVGHRARDALRERRRGHRGVAARLLGRHAHGGRGGRTPGGRTEGDRGTTGGYQCVTSSRPSSRRARAARRPSPRPPPGAAAGTRCSARTTRSSSSPPTTRRAARCGPGTGRWPWPTGPTCWSACRSRCRGPAWTACSAPPTSSRTCCCSARWTTR